MYKTIIKKRRGDNNIVIMTILYNTLMELH